MKLGQLAVSGALAVSLVLGGGVTPAAHAQDSAPAERYLVTLKDSAAQGPSGHKVYGSAADRLVAGMKSQGVAVKEVYSSVGVVVADMTATQAKAVKGHAAVLAVEEDSPVYTAAIQTSAPWHLDRIDQHDFNYSQRDRKYHYVNNGAGVTAYVIDTGVDPEWPDIKGRVSPASRDFVGDGYGPKGCTPHGNHVATGLGGTKYGVAKGVTLVGLRVFDCNDVSTVSTIVAAADHVVSTAKKPAVVNMSISNPGSDALDASVRRMINKGIPVVVAAGNDANYACDVSPARVSEAITVAASDVDDTRASFTNHGPCVDLFAPGEKIQVHDDPSIGLSGGTSLASPIVAGAVAVYLQNHQTASPADVTSKLIALSFKGVIKNAGSTPNRMVNAFGMSNQDVTTTPPPAPEWTMDNAGTKTVGFVSNVWGTLPKGATTAWTEVWTGKAWSRSQIRTANANGFVAIPLTYGMTTPGIYRYRVGTEVNGTRRYTEEFEFERVMLRVGHAEVKKINQVTNMWGTVPTAANRRVQTQVMIDGDWSTSQIRTADAKGYVVIPLTYGANKVGVYVFRAVFDTPYGQVYSEPFMLERVR